MARLQINFAPDAMARLLDEASKEHRPARMQAEVLLRQALGLPIPCTPNTHMRAGEPDTTRAFEVASHEK